MKRSARRSRELVTRSAQTSLRPKGLPKSSKAMLRRRSAMQKQPSRTRPTKPLTPSTRISDVWTAGRPDLGPARIVLAFKRRAKLFCREYKGGTAMPVQFVSSSGMADVAHGLLIAGLIVLFLYVAGPIVEPLVIAGLLSFILAPVMRQLRTRGIPKVVTAISCVALTLSVIGLLGATLGLQVRQLAEQLPSYENNLRAKIQLLGGMPLASGVLERASGTLRDLQDELSHVEKGSTQPSATQPVSPQPLPVE